MGAALAMELPLNWLGGISLKIVFFKETDTLV
jgi:hypothetical protein